MNTKGKVKFWLKLDANLRDSDSRLCANIWAKEIIKEKGLDLLNVNSEKISEISNSTKNIQNQLEINEISLKSEEFESNLDWGKNIIL